MTKKMKSRIEKTMIKYFCTEEEAIKIIKKEDEYIKWTKERKDWWKQ